MMCPEYVPGLLLLARLLLPLVLVAAGCGQAEGPQPQARAQALQAAPLRDPELAEVRFALEHGRADLALALLERVPGFEAACLRARAQLLAGDAVAALACLEQARELDPRHVLLLGTEIEIMASLLRVQAASELLAEALGSAGPDPLLLRARGVLELQIGGRAAAALEALERARAQDPELPFMAWPLAQAHLLVGRSLLTHAPGEATAHAMAALTLQPDLDDALELQAEGFTGELRFEEAIACYLRLEERGHVFGDTPAILHQRCATRMLLEHDRAGAIEHYLAARRRGMNDEGLGFGIEVLEQERQAALERGILAAEQGDWEAAEAAFEDALRVAPDDLEAGNHRAVARFEREDFAGAARAWERVLKRALREGLFEGMGALPDPILLNLAKAWRLAGEPGRARALLSDWIDGRPEHPWTEPARELLLALEAEALAGR